MHDHIARAMYYLSVHLLFASIVAAMAWALTSILRASATAKYWIWVATACNFVLPSGALIDKFWAPHLTCARPLGAIGSAVWELAHARRRDNLIRLLYEAALCALWFHPLMWLVGARIGLYRELSCDESVIRWAHGQELVSALAKLAVPKQAGVLQATASSHLSHRLALLAGPPQTTCRAASLLLTSLFA